MRGRTAVVLAAAAGVLIGGVAAGRAARVPRPGFRTGVFDNGIEYAAVGDGPRTMLFLPGGPGTVRMAGVWARAGLGMFRPFAEAGFTVWRLTRRRGMPAGHTMADMADDVAHVIENVFDGRVDVVVGMSYGGPIALYLAAHHPASVGRVVLVASAAAITDEGKDADRRYGEALGSGRFAEAGEALFEEIAPGDRLRWLRRLLGPLVGRVLASSGYNLPDVLVETRAEMDVDARPVLHRITAPVLLIAGDQDLFSPRDLVEETARLVPDCTLIWYEGLGHGRAATDKRVPRDVLAFVNPPREPRGRASTAPT